MFKIQSFKQDGRNQGSNLFPDKYNVLFTSKKKNKVFFLRQIVNKWKTKSQNINSSTSLVSYLKEMAGRTSMTNLTPL